MTAAIDTAVETVGAVLIVAAVLFVTRRRPS
jgi:hypothetical protein